MKDVEAVTILLVEDDPGHARLIEKNLRRAGLTAQIITLTDGGQARDFIFRQGIHRGSALPTQLLVLLDLNLPVLDGYQLLTQIKADEEARRVPVIILTSSDSHSDVAKCYDLGCNVFITKPTDYSMFSEAIKRLGSFVSVLTLPGAGGPEYRRASTF